MQSPPGSRVRDLLELSEEEGVSVAGTPMRDEALIYVWGKLGYEDLWKDFDFYPV